MKRRTQLVLVGHTKVRLVEGIKQIPTDRLVLVVGNNPNLEGEVKVYEIAEEIEGIFEKLMQVSQIRVDKENVFQAAIQLLTVIREEILEGNEVQINVSGSLRQIAIASYIAALVSGTAIYSVIPKYDSNFQEVGIEKFYSIPSFPIKELSREPIKILQLLEQEKQIESVEVLISMIYPNATKARLNRLRAKISYYLKSLQEEGFIRKQREGKKVTLELTPLGKIYMMGQSIKNLKKKTKT